VQYVCFGAMQHIRCMHTLLRTQYIHVLRCSSMQYSHSFKIAVCNVYTLCYAAACNIASAAMQITATHSPDVGMQYVPNVFTLLAACGMHHHCHLLQCTYRTRTAITYHVWCMQSGDAACSMQYAQCAIMQRANVRLLHAVYNV
jgi:hypothetical protein